MFIIIFVIFKNKLHRLNLVHLPILQALIYYHSYLLFFRDFIFVCFVQHLIFSETLIFGGFLTLSCCSSVFLWTGRLVFNQEIHLRWSSQNICLSPVSSLFQRLVIAPLHHPQDALARSWFLLGSVWCCKPLPFVNFGQFLAFLRALYFFLI